MENRKLLKIGIIGTIITAICCVTPALVVLFGALGLSAVVGVLDLILFPVLAVFVGITCFAMVRRTQEGPGR